MPFQNKILKEQQGGFTGTVFSAFFPALQRNKRQCFHITFYRKPVLFSLRNPKPSRPGEQPPQAPAVVLKFCFLCGLSHLALITKSSGPHTHKRGHLIRQELRTNSLNPASSGQAQSPPPSPGYPHLGQAVPSSFLTACFSVSELQAWRKIWVTCDLG